MFIPSVVCFNLDVNQEVGIGFIVFKVPEYMFKEQEVLSVMIPMQPKYKANNMAEWKKKSLLWHLSICHEKITRVYPQVSNISRTLVDHRIVDHSDVVGASPVGAAPTTSSFST